MKRRLAVMLSALMAALPLCAAQGGSGDPYEDIAQKLTDKALAKLSEKKIAVLSFDYLDGRQTSGSRVVAEKITNRLVEIGKLTVIERGMVEKLIRELEFQNSAAINADTAKRLGQGLGVEAIVTGTLEDQSYGNVEISARLIRTESFEILAAATAKAKKTWSDQPVRSSEAPSQTTYEQPAIATRSSGPRNVRGFFDFMMGASTAKMDLKFENSSRGVYASELGFSGLPLNFKSISFTGLTLNNSVPIALRAGGFGQILGGAFEFGVHSHGIKAQRTSYSSNGAGSGAFNFTSNPYLKVTTIDFAGDFLLRFPTGQVAFPYLGFGMGMSINTITSSYARMNSGGLVTSTLSEVQPGFLFRFPIGVRVNMSDKVGMYAEMRYAYNTFGFNRNISGETDHITISGINFMTGVGLLF